MQTLRPIHKPAMKLQKSLEVKVNAGSVFEGAGISWKREAAKAARHEDSGI